MPAVVVAAVGSAIGASAAVVAFFGGSALAAGIFGTVVAGALASALFKPDTPDQSALDSGGLLANKESNNNPIPVVAGRVRLGGTICYLGLEGDSNQYLNVVLGIAEGELDLNQHYFNDAIDEPLSEVFEFKTGTQNQTACSLAGRTLNGGDYWAHDHRLSGTAYAYARYKYDADKFPNGVPKLTLDVTRASTLFDPRTGNRDGAGDNPMLFLLDYLTNSTYGRGIHRRDVDDASFIAMANYCDQVVNGEKRYTLNGVLDTTTTPRENVKRILSGCLGSLVFTQGKYKAIIDRPDVPVATFDEDNITGGWSIVLENKRNRLNRIKIDYIDGTGKSDIAIIDSDELRANDNGLILEKTLRLPFTNTSKRAKQIGTIVLNQSRQQIACKFNTVLTDTTMSVEIGDVVYIKHQTPGWLEMNSGNGKLFRVSDIKFLANRQLEFAVIEYDINSYNTDEVVADDPSKDTDYPDGRSLLSPINLTASDELYVTTQASGVKSRIRLAWEAPKDFAVYNYYVEYKRSIDNQYTALTTTVTTTALLDDIDQGDFDFRVYCLSPLGVKSAPALINGYVTYGLLNPPAPVTGLSLNIINDVGFLNWDRSTDLDVIIGGFVEVRHAYLDTGWESASVVASAVAGSATGVSIPILQGTYYAKFIDASGKYSLTSVSEVLSTIPDIRDMNYVFDSIQNPAFAGAKTGLGVFDGLLKLNAGQTSGTYEFNQVIDLNTAVTSRVSSNLIYSTESRDDVLDSRNTLIDSWDLFDGDLPSIGVVLLMSSTVDAPSANTWSDWKVFTRGDHFARAFKFKIEINSLDANYQVVISDLSVQVDMPDRIQSSRNTYSLNSTHITYSKAFYVLPAIGITAKNMSDGDYYTITNETLNGFDVTFKNPAGNNIRRYFDYLSKAY